VRSSVALVCEIAAFSALGASLAWLMWATIEPVDPLASPEQRRVQTEGQGTLRARLAGLPDLALAERAGPVSGLAAGYVLHATRAGVDGGGAAILSVNGAPQAAFSVGEEIARGVRLARVTSQDVEIDAGGRRLLVAFPGAAPETAAARGPQPRTAIAASPANSQSLQPITRPGGGSGFAVTPQADPTALGASGLRPGDILLKVNGLDVSAANLADYSAQLKSGRPLDIVFERNGQISTARIGSPAP
jgi:general secretion pathway protein C